MKRTLTLNDDEAAVLDLALNNATYAEQQAQVKYAQEHYVIGGGYFRGDWVALVKLHEALKQQDKCHGIPAVATSLALIAKWTALRDAILTAPPTKAKKRR